MMVQQELEQVEELGSSSSVLKTMREEKRRRRAEELKERFTMFGELNEEKCAAEPIYGADLPELVRSYLTRSSLLTKAGRSSEVHRFGCTTI